MVEAGTLPRNPPKSPKLSGKIVIMTFCVCGCENVKGRCKAAPELWT
jgi:hypothetical protein